MINTATNNVKIGAYYSSMWCLENATDIGLDCPMDGDNVINSLANASNRGV